MINPDQDLASRLVAASPDCIGVLTRDGVVRYMNDRGIAAFGVACGRVLADAFPTDAAASLRQAVAAAVEGRPCEIRLADPLSAIIGASRIGPQWAVRMSSIPSRSDEGIEIALVAREILPDCEARGDIDSWRRFADDGPDIVWTADHQGAIDWLNAVGRRFVGSPRDHLGARGWLEIVHDDDYGRLDELVTRAVIVGEPLDAQARLRSIEGIFVWYLIRARPIRDPAGRITHWLGVATDIDAMKTAAQLLADDNEQLEQDIFRQLHEVQRSQSRLQAYFDACPDYICLLRLSNDNGLRYEDINPAAETLYRLDRSAIIGRSPQEIDDPATAAGIEENVRRCLATGATVAYQIERTFPSGPSAFVQVVGAPLEYFNEEEGLVLFCGRDITEQRGVEEALRQSQKMEAVGQLTGGLAHDFNNLLTGITGSLDLLQTRVAQGRMSQVDRYVTAAQGAATRAAALTHRLLAFSRRQTLDPKATAVDRLVSDMVELLRRTVGPEIGLEVEAHEGLWNVLVDPSQLENALLNLCINARDAMPEGGRIKIEMKNISLTGRGADTRELPPGDYVTLSVSDDGTGMAPDVVERIFEPFFTTKPIGSGTGLGLSMIYGFARQSGGQVRVHSSEGIGTTMRIILPRHIGETEDGTVQVALSDAPRARDGETVLVVDDEPTIRMLVTEVLDDLGYRVIEASDGAAGVALLMSETRIDLLVTDVGLPGGINGRQVAEAGRRTRPDLKILFITGYAENAVLNHGHLEKGMQVLTKPFALEALASRIKSLIGDT